VSHLCSLCNSTSKLFLEDQLRTFYQCDNCNGIFIPPFGQPSAKREKNRYDTHNNDVNDPRYQKFVSPITTYIKKQFNESHKGLDYGAGPGPVITKLLRDDNYNIRTYDPYFDKDIETLEYIYDYIVCCEVIEHFHQPYEEFDFLYSRLEEGGELVCMTDMYDESINFDNWYYKNDITHVFFYHKESLAYIKEAFSFKSLSIDGRLIIFRK